MSQRESRVVVVGGGIAATSCIEALFHEFATNPSLSQVALVAASRIVKRIANYELIGRHIEKFNVIETELSQGIQVPTGLEFNFIEAFVEEIKFKEKKIIFRLDKKLNQLSYDVLCLCMGASPRQPSALEESPCSQVRERTVFIRDSNSIRELKSKLATCKKVLIVGNGGIGLELVDKITNCDKVWIIRADSIGLNFLDAGAAKFLLESAHGKSVGIDRERGTLSSEQVGDEVKVHGPSLGPHWIQDLKLKGSKCDKDESTLEIIHKDHVKLVEKSPDGISYLLNVTTLKGRCIACDLVVFGIGVKPNTALLEASDIELDNEDGGGILIDDQMRTSVNQVYGAGDIVSCKKWKNDLWFQMRLWTQARNMGQYAGRCIAAHLSQQNPSIYFNFDCFTHCTSFFNHKVILLGLYNQEQIAHEVLIRVNPGKDYVKVLVNKDGRIFGATLVGESGLEETIENLIHDSIDINFLKDKLLDNTVDIEDYFD